MDTGDAADDWGSSANEDDIDRVLTFARELAEALEQSDRLIALQAARRSVEADEEARTVFHRLDEVGREIQQAVAQGEQPAAELVTELGQLKHEASRTPELWELLRRQADYVELLLAIDGAVFRQAPRLGRRLGD